MRFTHSLFAILALFLPVVHSAPAGLQKPLYVRPEDAHPFTIPTRYESTVLARRLLALSSTAVITTVFPSLSDSSSVLSSEDTIPLSNAPKSVASSPIGLPDYIAACEDTGNPTLLALGVSTSTRNAEAGSNVSLALSWWDSYVKLTNHEPWSAANLPRASLQGYLEDISDEEVDEKGIVQCFTSLHRDSRLWLPGDKHSAHSGKWVRLVVQEVYWIGGFGDRAYIGWFDIDQWRDVRWEDWSEARLPGES